MASSSLAGEAGATMMRFSYLPAERANGLSDLAFFGRLYAGCGV
jgi:hypothetical protein